MKVKIQKRKFIRNIIIGIIALLVVAFIINIAPGYKRNKYQDVTNLVIGDENVTETLHNPIYKDENGVVYISQEDVKQFLDKTIYYDEENNMVIATSEVSVASMEIGEKTININGVDNDTLDTIIYHNNIIYIPIEEMEIVYNLETKYLKDDDIVIIDKLNEGMIKAEAAEDTKIRFRPRGLSKKVGTLETGEVVSAFYTTSKGWRLIRTEDGIVGYVKANTLTNEYILRQDMGQKTETSKISANTQDGAVLNIEGNSVIIKDWLKITDEGILLKNTEFTNENSTVIWSNLEIENADISNYDNRTKLIKNIVSMVMKNNIKGINISVTSDDKNLERFIIELAPRLKEIGVSTNIVVQDSINEEPYTNIVNYIITKVNYRRKMYEKNNNYSSGSYLNFNNSNDSNI